MMYDQWKYTQNETRERCLSLCLQTKRSAEQLEQLEQEATVTYQQWVDM